MSESTEEKLTQARPIATDERSKADPSGEKLRAVPDQPSIDPRSDGQALKDASMPEEVSPRELHGLKVPRTPQ